MGIQRQAIGRFNLVFVDGAGARGSASSGDSHVIHGFIHQTHTKFGFVGDAKQLVLQLEAAIYTKTFKAAVVAVECVQINPLTSGGRSGVVRVVTPVIAIGFAAKYQGGEFCGGVDIPLVVDIYTTAAADEVVVRCRVFVHAILILLQEHPAIGNISFAIVIADFHSQPLVIAYGHAGFDHHIGHVIAFVHKTIAAGMGNERAKLGLL